MKTKHIWMLVGAAALIGGGIFLYNKNKKSAPKQKPFEPTKSDDKKSEFAGNTTRGAMYGCKDGTTVSNPRDCKNHGGAEWVKSGK